MMILGGCSSKAEKLPVIQFTGEPIPVMPDRYTRVLPDPGGARKGRDIRITAKENREWAKQLRDQHAQIVSWYKQVRQIQAVHFGGPK